MEPTEIVEALRRLEAKVDRLARHREPRMLLSKRTAAQLLGVDRGTTFESLIRNGHLHLITVGGQARIARVELERLLEEGVPATAPAAPRARRHHPTGKELAEEIAAAGRADRERRRNHGPTSTSTAKP